MPERSVLIRGIEARHRMGISDKRNVPFCRIGESIFIFVITNARTLSPGVQRYNSNGSR